MHTIQVELQEELVEKLAPYQDKVPELLELGLREWQKREQQVHERLLQALAASGKVELPRPYTSKKPYVRHSPVPISGKPVSEIVVEQRGSL